MAGGGAVLAAGVAGLAGLAGCLGEEGRAPGQLGRPEPHLEVDLADDGARSQFAPAVVHLVEDGTVEWVVAGDEPGARHDVTAYHPETHGGQPRIPEAADTWASPSLGPGDRFDHVFAVEGVYDYSCSRHEANGMVGSVVVGWPDPHDQPGLRPPDADVPETAVDALEAHNAQVRSFLEEEHGG